MPNPWSEGEIDAIVSDYFEMLARELRGETFNKTEHRKMLIGKLNGRSHGSIEFKHQNIRRGCSTANKPDRDGRIASVIALSLRDIRPLNSQAR